jgi:hypothetical protein
LNHEVAPLAIARSETVGEYASRTGLSTMVVPIGPYSAGFRVSSLTGTDSIETIDWVL